MKKKSLFIVLGMIISLSFVCAQEFEIEEIKQQKWKVGVSGGIGIRTASFKEAKAELVSAGVPRSIAESFYDRLKWVKSLSTEAYYLTNPEWGIGVKYVFSGASSSERIGNLNIEMKTNFHFVAPSLYWQRWINQEETWKFTANCALGYVNYRQNETANREKSLLTANSFGMSYELGLEHMLEKNWAIGINLSAFSSVVSSITVKDSSGSRSYNLKGDEQFSLARLDLSVGIRYYY